MVNIIDTHCHLYAEEFNEDRAEAISRAIGQGVTKILLPNIDLDSIDGLHSLADEYPDICIPMMGVTSLLHQRRLSSCIEYDF